MPPPLLVFRYRPKLSTVRLAGQKSLVAPCVVPSCCPVPGLDHDSEVDFASSPAADFLDIDPFSFKASFAASSSVPPAYVNSSELLIDTSGQRTSTGHPISDTPIESSSSVATGRDSVTTYLLCKMAEHLKQVTQELVSSKRAPGKVSLARYPRGDSSRPLPSMRV